MHNNISIFNKRVQFICYSLIFFTFFFSCKPEEDKIENNVFIGNYNTFFDITSSETLNFTVNAIAADDDLIIDLIFYREINGIIDTLIIEQPEKSNYFKRYNDTPPAYIEKGEYIYYYLDVTFRSGEVLKNAKRATVTEIDQVLLTETSRIFVYGQKTGETDGYDISENEGLFSSLSSTIIDNIDIMDADSSGIISNSWVSPSGGKFVRFNGFGYSEATTATLEAAFETGVKLDKINDIKEDDIILFQSSSTSAAIYITDVEQDSENASGRYEFNLKK